MLVTLLSILALPALAAAQNNNGICYDWRNRPYYCNNGLNQGARIGIGLGVAAGVLLLFALCGFWRRKQLRKQWARYRPPALPTQNGHHGNHNPYANNPYANNPPPPTQAYGHSQWDNNNNNNNNNNSQQYSGVQAPPATYQPSMAGQYTGNKGANPSHVNHNENGQNGHEHGYEWEQAREAERLEREQAQGAGAPPPGYNVHVDPTNGYAPPSGAPPANK